MSSERPAVPEMVVYSMHHKSSDCGIQGSVEMLTICAACRIAQLQAELGAMTAAYAVARDAVLAERGLVSLDAVEKAVYEACPGLVATNAVARIRAIFSQPQAKAQDEDVRAVAGIILRFLKGPMPSGEIPKACAAEIVFALKGDRP